MFSKFHFFPPLLVHFFRCDYIQQHSVRMMICYSNKDTFRHQSLFNQIQGTGTETLFKQVTGRLACLSKPSLAPTVGFSKCLTPFKSIIRGGGGEISPACSFLLKEIAEGQGRVCGHCSTSPNEITRQQHQLSPDFRGKSVN